jgi:hypothetical protein
MALSTFGAIMGFAAEMVQRTETFYKTMVQRAKNPILGEALQVFIGGGEEKLLPDGEDTPGKCDRDDS